MTARSEFAIIWVSRLDFEASDVDEAGEEKRDSEVGGDYLDVVVPDEGPKHEIRALHYCTGGCDDHDYDGRIESCDT